MKPMEAYVKKWYDALDNGKLMGMKCNRCGAYEFPPVPVCNNCSSTDLEWAEMSGFGEMVSFDFTFQLTPNFAPYQSTYHAMVKLDEGPTIISWLVGVEPGKFDELFEKQPLKVKMEAQKREKYSYPVFRIVE